MSFWSKIAAQFGKPTGLLGNLAGFIMASRSSNVVRSNWAVSLLNLQPNDRVLEIGFGPGIAIHKMSEIVKEGLIYGIDHSDIMLKQASKRNKEAISSGRVKLLLNSVSNLPSFEEPLDNILDINTFQFWENPIEDLKNLREHLRSGGIIALVQQPRKPGAKEEDTVKAGEKFAEYLKSAGFKEIKIEQKKMKPVSTVCVLGKK
jgi:SAM-dependent methyltransferase